MAVVVEVHDGCGGRNVNSDAVISSVFGDGRVDESSSVVVVAVMVVSGL